MNKKQPKTGIKTRSEYSNSKQAFSTVLLEPNKTWRKKNILRNLEGSVENGIKMITLLSDKI